MRRVLLDTSAYSAFMRGHESVKRAIQRADEIVLTPIVLGELRAGFRRGSRPLDNEDQLRAFRASSRVSVIEMDEETSERYAEIVTALRAAGAPIPTNDAWIAASAMQHGLRVLTTDEDFKQVPQVSVDHH